MPSPADYIINAGRGLGELSDSLYEIQDRSKKDLHERDDRAQQSAMADPLLRRSIERLINGEGDVDQIAIEHLAQQYWQQYGGQQSQQSQPQMQPNRAPGPWQSGYNTGPSLDAPIPYEEPVPSQRLPSGPILDRSTLAIGRDPGIQNRDVDQLTKLGSLLAGERRAQNTLELGYDKLGFQYHKEAGMEELRAAQAALARARALGIPQQMQIAEERVRIAWSNLGMRQQGLDIAAGNLAVRENQAFEKSAGSTIETVPQLRNILAKITNNPRLIPNRDYIARRAAEVFETLQAGFTSGSSESNRIWGGGGESSSSGIQVGGLGKMLSTLIPKVADAALSPEALDARRQISLALSGYRKDMIGSQITAKEFELINEIRGEQWSLEDTAAAMAALERSMSARLRRAQSGYPAAAGRMPVEDYREALPPLRGQSSTPNDPYGLGAFGGETGNWGYQGGR